MVSSVIDVLICAEGWRAFFFLSNCLCYGGSNTIVYIDVYSEHCSGPVVWSKQASLACEYGISFQASAVVVQGTCSEMVEGVVSLISTRNHVHIEWRWRQWPDKRCNAMLLSSTIIHADWTTTTIRHYPRDPDCTWKFSFLSSPSSEVLVGTLVCCTSV